MISGELELASVSRLYKALGDETRLRIVALLSHGELCVCHIEGALQLSQPQASRHLGILRQAGVVSAKREGSWVYYRLAEQPDARRHRQLRSVVSEFAKSVRLKADLRRVMKTKGPEACR